jgi:c-di-GMP-related signal transduction protein
VLRLGNSAYYGVSGKIATVQHAAVLLGQKTLGEIITMAGISIWATACQGLTPKISLGSLMGKALLISLLSVLL